MPSGVTPDAHPGWALRAGIICLVAGLTTASFVAWGGRWR
jgi:hypothetical protein